METVTIDLNDEVRIILTEKGAEILNEYNKRVNDSFKYLKPSTELRTDFSSGVYSTQLYHLFEVFSNMHVGCEKPFIELQLVKKNGNE